MAKAIGSSAVFTKLKKKGLAKAHKSHRGDETTIPDGGGDLPAGIEGGVAELVQVEIKTHEEGNNKGELFAFISGVVKEPIVHEGIKCKGRRTSLFIPLYDTPNSPKKPLFEDHYADLLNELRKMGVSTDEMEYEELEEIINDLAEEGIHFKFHTWQGKPTEQFPNPRVNHQFMGAIDDYVDDSDPDDEVVEGEADVQDAEKQEPEEQEDESEAVEGEEEVSLDDLGTAADSGDDEAIATLTKKASEAGLDPDDYDEWSSLATALGSFSDDGGDEKSIASKEEDEESDPEVGDILNYIDTLVEVTKVYARKKTADVQDIENDDEYQDVAWSDLTAS